MALKGNLRDFSVTQLFNLISLARKTGTLTVEGPNEAAWISFQAGKLIYAQLGNEDGTLVGILTRSGRITAKQAQVIKSHAGEKSDKELGLLLINAGYLTQQDILAGIRQYIVDIVYRLFTWVDGFFRSTMTSCRRTTASSCASISRTSLSKAPGACANGSSYRRSSPTSTWRWTSSSGPGPTSATST